MEIQYNKKKQFIINTIYIFMIAFMIYVFFRYGISLVSPFIFAFLIAYLLKKLAIVISSSTKLPQKLVSFLVILIFYSTAGVLVSLLGVRLISMITRLISMIPVIYEKELGPFLLSAYNGIEEMIYNIDPAIVEAINQGFNQFLGSLGDSITNFSLGLLGSLSNFASSLPAFFVKVLLMVISTFFIAIDFDSILSFSQKQFSKKVIQIIITIKQYIVNTLFVVIRSYALIMAITFIELLIGFTILGIKNAMFKAFLIAIFDILPVLGTGGIMIPWMIITFIQGNFSMGIGLFVIYIIVTIIRNIIEPKIVGSRLGLHPVIILMGMYVGANLLGIIGLLGFPITLSLLKHLNDTGVIKIFK